MNARSGACWQGRAPPGSRGALSDGEKDQLKYVRELILVIRKDLIEHGQLDEVS